MTESLLMNYFTLYLLFFVSLLPLIGLSFAYNAATWRWKVQPSMLVWLGLLFLVVSFGLHLYLEVAILKYRPLLAGNSSSFDTNALATIESFMVASQALQKLLEFLSIPIAVSMIGAALLGRAEASLHEEVQNYRQRIEMLEMHEQHFERADSDLRVLLDDNVRGEPILKAQERTRCARWDYLDACHRLNKDFSLLIERGIVYGPVKPKRRR